MIEKVTEYKDSPNTEKLNCALEELVNETELLLFGFSENYPALLDIRHMKERNNLWYDFNGVIAEKIILILSSFKSFIIDHFSSNWLYCQFENQLKLPFLKFLFYPPFSFKVYKFEDGVNCKSLSGEVTFDGN